MSELIISFSILSLLLGGIMSFFHHRFNHFKNELLSLSTLPYILLSLISISILVLFPTILNYDLPDSPLLLMLKEAFEFTTARSLIAITALILLLCNILFSGEHLKTQNKRYLFYPLSMFSCAGLVGMLFVEDLFDIYLFIEFMSLPMYVLVAFRLQEAKSTAAGYNYMIIGSIATLLILAGFSCIYFVTGSMTLNQLPPIDNFYIKLATGLILSGILIKGATFPAHSWLIPAHANTPTGNSAMLSGIVIQTTFFVGVETLFRMRMVTPEIGSLLIILSILSMVAGNLLALRQNRTKGMLAGSSIVQMGYLVFFYGCYILTGSAANKAIALYFIIAHGLSKALAFLSTGVLYRHFGITKNKQLNGVGRIDPYPAFMLAFALASLAAISPLPIFLVKWSLISDIFLQGNKLAVIGFIFLEVNSLVSLKYYLPPIFNLFRFDPENISAKHPLAESFNFSSHNWMMLTSLTIIFIGIIFISIIWFIPEQFPFTQQIFMEGIF